MLAGLRKAGVQVAEIYYCPHNVLSDCACRKPRPGMLLAAARDVGARPRSAWMVGDKPMDVQTGRAFGCRTAWVGPKAWRRRFAAEVRPWSPDVVAGCPPQGAPGLFPSYENPGACWCRTHPAGATLKP